MSKAYVVEVFERVVKGYGNIDGLRFSLLLNHGPSRNHEQWNGPAHIILLMSAIGRGEDAVQIPVASRVLQDSRCLGSFPPSM
jgi:hypothetical protein